MWAAQSNEIKEKKLQNYNQIFFSQYLLRFRLRNKTILLFISSTLNVSIEIRLILLIFNQKTLVLVTAT